MDVVVYKSCKGGKSHRSFPPPASAAAAAATAVVIILMMNRINFCGAAVLVKWNATYDRYCVNGGASDENCLIADDLDLEFLMDSYVSRMLADKPDPVTDNTNDPKKALSSCGKPGEPSCLGPKKPPPTKPETDSIYKRKPNS
ncbi:hypothetical protein PanWU01x14_304860 [Parasponia andersonii]|uniref:Uncharacterized protein n=1 Tax=Parasponia andersonii TaxID=3476 RepID=A0A2P5ASD8_PARAD|nr:hypothetical protein PanWU01x14_304860 [Parasponia andersonii]